jgi:hypothetical protein
MPSFESHRIADPTAIEATDRPSGLSVRMETKAPTVLPALREACNALGASKELQSRHNAIKH